MYFLDSALINREVCIGFPFLGEGDGKAPAMFHIINEVLADYGMDLNDFNLFVSDGANVMKSLANLMKGVNPHMHWLWCVAHRLQLVINHARDHNTETDRLIERFHLCVNMVRRCKDSRIAFGRSREDAGLKPVSIKYRNITRWTTTYDSLKALQDTFADIRKGLAAYNGQSKVTQKALRETLQGEMNREFGYEEDEEIKRNGEGAEVFLQDSDKVRLDNLEKILRGHYQATKKLQATASTWPLQLSGCVVLLLTTIDYLEGVMEGLNKGTSTEIDDRADEIAFGQSLLDGTIDLKDDLMRHPLVMDSYCLDTRLELPFASAAVAVNRLRPRILIECTPTPGALPAATKLRDASRQAVQESKVSTNVGTSTRGKKKTTSRGKSSKKASTSSSASEPTEFVLTAEGGDESVDNDHWNVILDDDDDGWTSREVGHALLSSAGQARQPVDPFTVLRGAGIPADDADEFLFDEDAYDTSGLTAAEVMESINFDTELIETVPLVPPSIQLAPQKLFVSDDEEEDDDEEDMVNGSPSKILLNNCDSYWSRKKKLKMSAQSRDRMTKYLVNAIDLTAVSCSDYPLQYWRDHIFSNPVAYSLLLTIAAAPCTSCVNERIFAMAGNIVIPPRSRLAHLTVERLVMMSFNKNLFRMILRT